MINLSNRYKLGDMVTVNAPESRRIHNSISEIVDIKNSEVVVVRAPDGTVAPIHVSRISSSSKIKTEFSNIEPGQIICFENEVYPVIGMATSMVNIDGYIDQSTIYPIVGLSEKTYMLLNENLKVAYVDKVNVSVMGKAHNMKVIEKPQTLISPRR